MSKCSPFRSIHMDKLPVAEDPPPPGEIQQLQASEGPSDQISAISLDGAFSFSFRAAVPNVFQDEKRFRFFLHYWMF